jgi:hypothetical protein
LHDTESALGALNARLGCIPFRTAGLPLQRSLPESTLHGTSEFDNRPRPFGPASRNRCSTSHASSSETYLRVGNLALTHPGRRQGEPNLPSAPSLDPRSRFGSDELPVPRRVAVTRTLSAFPRRASRAAVFYSASCGQGATPTGAFLRAWMSGSHQTDFMHF